MRFKSVGCYVKRVCFIHCIRYKIISSRKDFSYRTHLGGNTFNTVDYSVAVVRENNIAVFAHQFYYQMLDAQIPHFIKMFKRKIYNALKFYLLYRYNAGVIQMFSQKHAESRSRRRTRLILICKIYEWKRGVCRYRKPVLASVIFDSKHKLVRLGLRDFIKSSIR